MKDAVLRTAVWHKYNSLELTLPGHRFRQTRCANDWSDRTFGFSFRAAATLCLLATEAINLMNAVPITGRRRSAPATNESLMMMSTADISSPLCLPTVGLGTRLYPQPGSPNAA
jgi:hypothetical protein